MWHRPLTGAKEATRHRLSCHSLFPQWGSPCVVMLRLTRQRLAKGLFFEDRINPIEETLRNLDAVSADDLVRMADTILTSGPTTTTILGATEDVA